MTEKYKTITENDAIINPRVEGLIKDGKKCKSKGACFCDGSCKTELPNIEGKKNNILSALFSREKTIKKEDILKINRYEIEHCSGFEGISWSSMEISEDGEYVRLKDILDLFE